MEKNMEYETGDRGDTCDQNFELINEMSGLNMPRDYLACLTPYFFLRFG